MPRHVDVATTCTASHLVDWNIPNLTTKDEKLQVNTRLQTVTSLISQGYKRDFDVIYVIITEKQINAYGVDEFLTEIGFEKSFQGDKEDGQQRHKETGPLSMWTIKPRDYEAGLKALKAKLEEIKDRIDPPKKPDPKRQKFPDLLLSALRKNSIVQDNAAVDNPIHQILLVPEEKAYLFIKMNFGIDIRKWKNLGTGWTSISTRTLKSHQKAWKEELV